VELKFDEKLMGQIWNGTMTKMPAEKSLTIKPNVKYSCHQNQSSRLVKATAVETLCRFFPAAIP
jgi:hypothetical protein